MTEFKWGMKIPAYSALRILFHSDSPAEAMFHSRRKVKCLAKACRSTSEQVDDIYRESQATVALNRVRIELKDIPWLGGFRAAAELFVLCRLLRPSVVLETGVGSGWSSSHILAALDLNGEGELFSIDLPNADPGWSLPQGLKPGFLVPEELKKRWRLIIGDSNKMLPGLLDELGAIDMFLHDSEHSYETMSLEFTQSWPHLNRGGILISDDAMWNSAMLELAASKMQKIGFLYHNGGSAPVAYIRKN